MKYIQHTVLLSLFGFLTFFAKTVGIGPACTLIYYQPKAPESLVK